MATVAVSPVFVLNAGSASSEAPSSSQCYSCHEDDVKESFDMLAVHIPFVQKKCTECHVNESSVEAPLDSEGTNRTFTESTKLKWIGESPSLSKIHWITLSAKEVADTLYVKVRDDIDVLFMETMNLPPEEDLKKMKVEQAPPKISEVKVLQVERKLFFSAKIGWKTNEIANSQIVYGIKSLDKSSPVDINLVSEHVIDLAGLKAKKTYRFKVISQDMFGNKSESDIFTFSTSKLYSASNTAGEKQRPAREKVKLEGEFFFKDGDRLAKFTANQPVSVSVGVEPIAVARKGKSRVKKEGREFIDHYWLKSELDLHIINCYTCHPEVKGGRSHPVNVYPKPGMTIPPEYTTLSDGRITCMSCHGTHASNYDFMLIKPTSKALCTGCHKEFG
ncbi:MAG: cytochrome c3 family protein [Thermodesulfobacteriota bacterium]|nr:cytochrome c3 family protein [Thermodesulfobacteriota bacterium]